MSLSKQQPDHYDESLEFTFTNQCQPQLIYQNHIFHKNNTYPNGNIYWQCVCRHSIKDGIIIYNCKSSCLTSGLTVKDKFIRKPSKHNHEPLPKEKIQFKAIKTIVRKRLKVDKTKAPLAVFKETLAKITTDSGIEMTRENSRYIKILYCLIILRQFLRMNIAITF